MLYLFDYYKLLRCKIQHWTQKIDQEEETAMLLFCIGLKCPVLSLSYFPHGYLIAELQGSSKAPLARKLVNH